MVEVVIPDDIHPALLVIFGCTTASVVSLMLIAMLNATFMLVGILRYDCVNREVNFKDFWRKRCDSDWRLALRCFAYGVPLFMCVLAQVGWVIFWDHEKATIYASTLVSVIALCTIVLWFAHTDRKWSGFLLSVDAKLYNPEAGRWCCSSSYFVIEQYACLEKWKTRTKKKYATSKFLVSKLYKFLSLGRTVYKFVSNAVHAQTRSDGFGPSLLTSVYCIMPREDVMLLRSDLKP